MNAGIQRKYAAALSVCLCAISVGVVAAQSTQKSIMDEVKRLIGPGARLAGQAKAVGQECDRYVSRSGIAFVDRRTRKVVQVQFTRAAASRKDIGAEAARHKMMDWLSAHDPYASNWWLDAEQRLDRGRAGVCYQFDWSRNGQSPVMHAEVTGAGDVRLWYRANGGPQLSHTPKISAGQAFGVVERAAHAKLRLRRSPHLMVRYFKGRYRLVWDIWMAALDDPRCTGAAAVDAHSGELVYLFPLQRPPELPGLPRKR